MLLTLPDIPEYVLHDRVRDRTGNEPDGGLVRVIRVVGPVIVIVVVVVVSAVVTAAVAEGYAAM